MDVNKYSDRIQKRARELGMDFQSFKGECVKNGISEQAATYWWDGVADWDKPTRRVQEAISKALDLPREKLFKE